MGRKFTIFALFYFVFEGKFQVQVPLGGLYSEGRFNGGFFGVTILGGLYLEGLIRGGAYFRNFTVLCPMFEHNYFTKLDYVQKTGIGMKQFVLILSYRI